MSDINARLDMLRNQIGKRNIQSEAVIAELRSILSAETHPYRHEMVQEAIVWAKIAWGHETTAVWGGRENVLNLLLQSLAKARM